MILGLTGGVATGKSSAAAVLAGLGVHVIDCDVISRYLTDYDTLALQAIEQTFGPSVFYSAGALNRTALAEQVFCNEAQRRKLEHILHPRIAAVVFEGIRWARQGGRDAVAVIPLLFESGWQGHFDETWVVSCSAEKQLARAKARGWSEEAIRARIKAQLPLTRKEELANVIVDNNGSLDELADTVRGLWEGLSNRK